MLLFRGRPQRRGGEELSQPPSTLRYRRKIAGHRSGNLVPRLADLSEFRQRFSLNFRRFYGVAYAGGLEWACFADIRIVEEHTSFGVTCRRWNIGLADGGTQRLPRIVGMGRAMELIITGRVIGAIEAERIGLANEVVPKGKSLERALEMANVICQLPQTAMHTDKEAAVRGFGQPLSEGLRIEAECFNRSIYDSETAEGVRRFLERDHPDRKPDRESVTPGIVKD
ncbi:MAG: enoyl-CoA hydratase [Proteobacteria bacterium]|nr:enoyl-CoA hydratase [Pseudomonadota bacterium]